MLKIIEWAKWFWWNKTKKCTAFEFYNRVNMFVFVREATLHTYSSLSAFLFLKLFTVLSKMENALDFKDVQLGIVSKCHWKLREFKWISSFVCPRKIENPSLFVFRVNGSELILLNSSTFSRKVWKRLPAQCLLWLYVLF